MVRDTGQDSGHLAPGLTWADYLDHLIRDRSSLAAIALELSQLAGTQPRVSPKGDAVLFCAVNEETGKRDVYRMSDRGGQPQNLTNTPDADDADPVWSRDGRMIAYASDRGLDAQGRPNYDVWVLDLSKPQQPMQVTVNGSHDDTPLFDPRGGGLYFRSNRSGAWGVWRVSLK